MHIYGAQVSSHLNTDFAKDFPEQFILAPYDDLQIPSWEQWKGDAYTLYRDANARTKRIIDNVGAQIGWFLGEGVDAEGQYIGDPMCLPYNSSTQEGWDIAEKFIEGIAGRYCVIIDTLNLHRIYGDPVGDFSVVYNAKDRIVASSTLLALTQKIQWNKNFDRDRILAGSLHFSLQQTPDSSLRRFLPNHYLDIDTFTCIRHWPRNDTQLLEPHVSVTDNLDQISLRLKQIVSALARNAAVIIPISGGRDSRNIVGATGDDMKHIQSGFAWQFHKMSRIDTQIGKAIADRIGLTFNAYDNIKTTRKQRLKFFLRTGYADGGSIVRVLGIQNTMPRGNIILRGNVMEILRANQWNHVSISRGVPRTRFGIKRLLIDPSAPLNETVRKWEKPYMEWAETLPLPARKRQLDFGFFEHLLPNTLGVRHFGDVNNFVMNPFADRKLIQLSIQIPPEVRKADFPNTYLLERNCSHLADIPFEKALSANPELLPKPD